MRFPPEVENRLDRLATETGHSREEFVQDAMAGYLPELEQLHGLVDGRYDDIKSGRVKLIDGQEVVARLRSKSVTYRS